MITSMVHDSRGSSLARLLGALEGVSVEALRRRGRAARASSLCAFLVEEGLLREDAPSLLESVESGFVQFDDAGPLLAPGGLEALRGWSGEGPLFPGVGEVLGKCRLVEEVGRGGSAVVYRAEHETLGIPVAVKVLVGSCAGSRARLGVVEARTLARLAHPNVVRVMDLELSGAYPYLVLEYVGGPSLHALLRERERLPPTEAARIAWQLAEALEHAQERGVLHRDLKPANVLLTEEGVAKLADLGLARGLTELEEGPVRGTLPYLAPECFDPEAAVDARADMYALGVTLYQMLTGMLPVAGSSPNEVLQLLQERPLPPTVCVSAVPSRLSALTLRLIDPVRERRPASYRALLEALAPWVGGREPGWANDMGRFHGSA